MSASKWDGFPRAALDFETTSTDPHTARIVSAAFVKWTDGVRPDVIDRWLVNPGVEIPAEAAAVHGITTEHAREHGIDPAQMLFEVTGKVALSLGRRVPVVIYNAPYDLTLLEAENVRHGIDTLVSRLGVGKVGPIFDPVALARHAAPKRMVSVKDEHGNLVYAEGSKATVKECRNCTCGATDWTLTSTCKHYRVPLGNAHDAAADALAAGRLFSKVMAAHPKLFNTLNAGSLHQSQVGWAKDQADKLRGIFNWLKVADHDECPDPANHQCVCPEWPLHRACAPALVGGA